MKRYTIDLDLKKCVSCGACMIACMDQNDINVEEGEKPFRNVFDTESEKDGKVTYSHLSLACMHCVDAPCIVACPSACIRKDEETNLTVFDTTNCIGCHSCAMACPFGIPSFGKDGKMKKCDGCYVRVHHGMLPACVKACPVGVLRLIEYLTFTYKNRKKQPTCGIDGPWAAVFCVIENYDFLLYKTLREDRIEAVRKRCETDL